jgi:hypothetical protein
MDFLLDKVGKMFLQREIQWKIDAYGRINKEIEIIILLILFDWFYRLFLYNSPVIILVVKVRTPE